MSKALVRNANALWMAAAILVVSIIGLLTWSQFSAATNARSWVLHTHEVIDSTNQLAIAMRAAESNQRGYLLTGRDDYLVLYREEAGQIPLLEADLLHLTADNPEQQARLHALSAAIQRKLEALSDALHMRQDRGAEAAMALMRSEPGEQEMERIRSLMGDVTHAEDRLLIMRQDAEKAAEVRTRWLAITGTGFALLMLGVSWRILENVRADLARSANAQHVLADQLRTAFNTLSQGIAVFGPDRRLQRWNQGFQILLSLPHAMLREGTGYEAIVEQATQESGANGPFLETEDQIRLTPLRREAATPVVYQRWRPKDDRSFEFRRTNMPDTGFVLTVTDITEQVKSEAMARDAQRLQAMGQLTGGIAHDFNNLLTVVLGNLEMALPKVPEDHPIRVNIERAISSAKRGATLNQQMLAFARKQPLAPVSIDVSVILPDMVGMLRRTLGEHIQVQLVESASLWHAMADPVQLESALLNLALNARDAMPRSGRLTIEVANRMLDETYAAQNAEVTPGDYVMIAVSDNGTGMSPEVQARVFEPFFTTKEPGQGTGLGLAMVFGFAKQSGGHVKIYSELGEGTTVRLYLPRAIGVPLAPQQRAGTMLDVPQGTGTIMVVEDDTNVREVATTMLRELGYTVLEAADGPEALRVFGEAGARVDLLLVDVILPNGMRGNDVARRIAEIRPDVRTLFMSGYTENAIVHHGRLDDGVHLIGKPFTRETLARKVAEVLGQSVPKGTALWGDKVVNITGMQERRRTT
jgi:signal transduction histidine kinase/CHASE3 domain sensor protein/ActR/RegA family two-component response regulator